MANQGPPNSDYSPPIHGGFPDPEAEAPYEEGFPLPEAPSDPHLVPGLGKDALPHYLTFSQITNWANRTYRWGHDEALRMNRANALAIRRDPVVMDALRTRQIPLVQLPGHVECQNSQDQRQAEGAAFIQARIEEIPQFQRLKMHLAEALWYGRYGVQLEYQWDWVEGQRCLKVRGFKPINGDKIIFKFSGQAGVLVHATFPGTWQTTEMGRAHFFTPREREQVILHRHEPEDADFFEPELAGSLQGVGIRGRIYWLWYLRSQVTAFLMDYLERVGAGGLTLYYYEAGNIQSLQEVKTAAETQWRNNALLFPRYRDGTSGGPGVEQLQSSQAGAELLRSLITEYYDDTIRRFILGQSQASEAAGAGLGSGISEFLEGNLGRYIKYDAVNLQETLTTDLVHVLQKYSPYADCPPFTYKFDVDKPNSGEIVSAAQTFYEMGGAIDEDSLREIVGLEKPQEGHSILSKMGNLSPQAVGMAPEGVPMAGTPGPAPQSPQGEMPQPGSNGTPQGPIQQKKAGPRLTLQKLGQKIRLALRDKSSRRAKMSRQNRTPTHEELLKLRPLLAKAAQEEYDEWQPYPEEGDPECGFGGICDRIADRLSGVINEHFPDVDVIEGGQPGDDHAYNIYRIGGEHFGVNIHPNVYETGGGYNWKKIPDVQFQPEDVDVWEHEPIEEDESPFEYARKGKRVKMARMSRKKKPRAWNPFPYIRAIRRHFGDIVGASDPEWAAMNPQRAEGKRQANEIDHAIVNLADQALAGDKHSLLILGDALQDSHEPEWFQTIMDHQLAWPPWEGTGLRNTHKAPRLMRYNAPVELSHQERSLLSSPSNADDRTYTDVVASHYGETPEEREDRNRRTTVRRPDEP